MTDLGARWDGEATTLRVHSPPADRVRVEVRPSGDPGRSWVADLEPEGTALWCLRSERLRPGDHYGLRLSGPGLDPARLVLDPACLAVSGEIDWAAARFDVVGADTAAWVPWSVLVDTTGEPAERPGPAVRSSDRVVYEANVAGLTARHPLVPPELRGTYLGLAHPAVIGHLVDLGVTTIELLPVAHFVHARHLWARGMRNLWGYDPVAWFAPHGAYATADDGAQVTEFRAMVQALHDAGLEVLVDVVLNHTGEGGPDGPTVSFRGIDPAWYRRHDDGSYEDFTGCHNTVELRPAAHRALAVDALRHWVEHLGVDGFRFDLATALVRDGSPPVPDMGSALLAAIADDPVVGRSVLVAEPWDAGWGGYALGSFPPPWHEWNDRFRDGARRAWLGAGFDRRELALRLCGSDDVVDRQRRPPAASVNFVTAHDGFTLADLTTYSHKRNDDNGEGGRDGSGHEIASGLGAEGPTSDVEVITRRERARRNLMAMLLVARGTPMLLAGDELANSQAGNNNAYCRDDEVGHVDWDGLDGMFHRFVRRALAVRAAHPELHADRWIEPDEVEWRGGDGGLLDHTGWHSGGDVLVRVHPDLAVVLCRGAGPFTVPGGGLWTTVLDTSRPDGGTDPGPVVAGGATLSVDGPTVLVLARP